MKVQCAICCGLIRTTVVVGASRRVVPGTRLDKIFQRLLIIIMDLLLLREHISWLWKVCIGFISCGLR
jgi:hypothetical protein